MFFQLYRYCKKGNLYKLQQQNYAWHKAALKITQNSQENTCVRVSLQAFRSAVLLKRDSNISVFLWICKILKSTYFEEHLWTICRWKVCLNINQRVLSQIFLQIFLLYVFKTLKQLFSRLHSYYWVTAFSFLTIFFTISGNVLYYESHFACQFISKAFSVIKVGFHNSKVKTRSFLVIIMGVKPRFSNFASKKLRMFKRLEGSIGSQQIWSRLQTRLIHHFNFVWYLKNR